MKRILITGLFVGLLLVLLVGAVFALKGPASTQTAAPPDTTANLAPAATNKYNHIALPLDSEQDFLDNGYTWDYQGLASYVGSGVVQVLEWNPNTGSYYQYIPGLGGDNNALKIGGTYWLELDSNANNVVSFVGDVPPQGSVQFNLVRPASSSDPCKYNEISLPLDRSDITTPQELADDIGNVEQVLSWNASNQTFLQYIPGLGGDNIEMKIGYPYLVCLDAGGSTVWP